MDFLTPAELPLAWFAVKWLLAIAGLAAVYAALTGEK